MAVRIEPQPMPEARLPRELLFGHASNVVNQPGMGLVQLPQYFGEREASFLLGPLRVEGINAAVRYIPWRCPSLDDEREVLQRLLLPRSHVGKDVFDRPIARHAGF